MMLKLSVVSYDRGINNIEKKPKYLSLFCSPGPISITDLDLASYHLGQYSQNKLKSECKNSIRFEIHSQLRIFSNWDWRNKYWLRGHLLQDLRPAKIPNNARAPLGARALLKEFLPGVNPKTNAEQEVFIPIIKTGYFVGKKSTFILARWPKTRMPPYLIAFRL